MNALLISLLATLSNSFAAEDPTTPEIIGRCQERVQEAALALDGMNYSGRWRFGVESKAVRYAGKHAKEYAVQINYVQTYTAPYEAPTKKGRYQVTVLEFEGSEGDPCTVQEIKRVP